MISASHRFPSLLKKNIFFLSTILEIYSEALNRIERRWPKRTNLIKSQVQWNMYSFLKSTHHLDTGNSITWQKKDIHRTFIFVSIRMFAWMCIKSSNNNDWINTEIDFSLTEMKAGISSHRLIWYPDWFTRDPVSFYPLASLFPTYVFYFTIQGDS